MDFLPNWEKTKQRFEALWQREIVDRCCVSVLAPRDEHHFRAEPFPEQQESQEKYWFDGEFVLRRNLDRFEHTYFGGDAFPNIFLNLGASGHAGYFRNVRYHLDGRTVWFDPIIRDWATDTLEFEPEQSLYGKTLRLARYLVQESGGRYFVSMPDISGNLDALAHLRGSENLLMDLILAKENVHQALALIQRTWLRANREVQAIVQAGNRGGCTIGWLHTWAPGFHGQLQCDLSVMISPDHFAEFVMPELAEQSRLLDYPLYHLDGVDQLQHLDRILSLKDLKMVQWTCVAGQPPPTKYLPELKKIQAAGKGLLIKIEPEWFESLMTGLSSKGLYLVVDASSKEETDGILRIAEKLTHD
jgi:hypothetical protein